MTTGVGKLFTALSVRLGWICTAPEATITVNCDVLVAASAMTRAADTVPACARASRAPNATAAPGARRLETKTDADCRSERASGLLNDSLDVERTGVETGGGRREADQVQAQVERCRCGCRSSWPRRPPG